jgi:hypothetical protein
MISQQTREELKQLLTHIEENTLNLLESSPPDNILVSDIFSKGIGYMQLPSPQLSVDLCSIGLTYLLKDRGDKIAPTNLK